METAEQIQMDAPPSHLVAQVIVDVPSLNTNKPFDYLVPSFLQSKIRVGSRVAVPFGARKVQGYVIKVIQHRYHYASNDLKEIDALLDDEPPLTEELVELAQWMSQKYVCFISTAIQTILPSAYKSKSIRFKNDLSEKEKRREYQLIDRITKRSVSVVIPRCEFDVLKQHMDQLPSQAVKQKEILQYMMGKRRVLLSELLEICRAGRSSVQALVNRGLLEIIQEDVFRDPYQGRTFAHQPPLQLTKEQECVLHSILEAVNKEEFRTFLLHGVTGSGKTEVYLQAIDVVLKQGKDAVVLVPEISLTHQMVERFRGRFGEKVVVLHSGLSVGERYDAWQKILKGEAKVAIGARSALFAPFRKLGLIILDEEHESSYKQEETPRYHAREVAMFRGKYHSAPVILGSATPSLESYSRGRKNVYTLLSMTQRVQGRPLPSVEIVDMRKELQEGNRSLLSRTLHQKIEQRLAQNEQMVLFLNRRGFSTLVICRDCGFALNCPHCEISLTYHKVDQTCRCHYCGYTEPVHPRCPQCQSEELRFFGTGTQKVEETLAQLFPGMRVIRMDVDTTRQKGAHEKLLTAFGRHEADCLVGTQMIAKGLDFENVTLVGVIAADGILHLPDFRSAERTFQLLTQVSGRAGRHQKPGEVVVQTYSPEHYSIRSASLHDYRQFYEQEMRFRHRQGYPPFYFLCLLQFAHEDMAFCLKCAEEAVRWLKQRLSRESIILGPVAAPISRIKDRYRYQCMIKYKNEPNLASYLMEMMEAWHKRIYRDKLQLTVDMEPQMIL
jgi:primosomal protein N' (replication factor Y)